ncbi:MAG: LCP family protein [Armatimonadetes bacterium]|nr:LCP family protein [Armatimonadota bacterium]
MTSGKKRPTNWKLVLPLLLLGLLVGAGAVGLGVYTYVSGKSAVTAIREVFDPPFGGKDRITVLALGVDNSDPAHGLSDTMILASLDIQSRTIYAVSIPRDTRVEDESVGYTHKINEAYRRGGHELAVRIVQGLLGIPVDYYMKVDLRGFQKAVDILGGVEIDVDKNMRYRDRAQNLYINLRKGKQHLDGNKAMQYVRYRRDAMGDITRTQRQQKFLHALLDKVLAPANLPNLPRLMGQAMRHVETNLTPKDMIYLAKMAAHMPEGRLRAQTLPGTPQSIDGISYWALDEEKVAEVLAKHFMAAPSERAPTVMVLNGNGIRGSASQFAEALAVRGFRIYATGNADRRDYPNSVVVANNGSVEKAREIASLLPGATVAEESAEKPLADITIILGKDYRQIP